MNRSPSITRDSRRIGERSLRGGLIGMFLIAAGLTLVVGIVGYFQVDAIRNILAERMTVHANARFYATRLDARIDEASNLAIEYSIGSNEHALLQYSFGQINGEIRSILDELKKWTNLTPEEQASMGSIAGTYKTFFATGQDLIAAKGELEAATQSFENNSAEFQPIRENIETLLLDQGQPALENIYWQMAFHEAQFLGQSRLLETLQELNVDIIDLRVALLNSLEEFERGQQVISLLDNYAIALSQVVAALHQQEESLTEVAAQTESFYQAQDALLRDIQTLVDLETERLDDALELANARVQTTILMIIGLVVVTTVIGVGLGIYNAERIASPIKDLATVSTSIARGALEQSVVVDRRDEIGVLAEAFNSMTGQLRSLIGSLEQRVAERTSELERRSAYLQASAEVGRAASSILDPDALIRQVVDFVRDRFDFYYVGIFLLDEAEEWAVLRAGTGEAGRAMLARGHQIKVGEGMVGWSVAHGQPRVAREVGEDAVRLATTELPDTRSEGAWPLRSRGRVLGAITVQHTEVAAFDQDAIVALQTMADQVAVALDNARLFAESQSALEAERRAYGEVGAQAWKQMLRSQAALRYLCDDRDTIRHVEGEKPVEMVQAFREGRIVQSDENLMAMPIRIHNEVLGAIRLRKPDNAGQWTAEEIALVETLAGQLDVALESARLYQETQHREVRERLIGQVATRMRESLELESMLKTAAGEMRQALDLDDLVIRLATPEMVQEEDVE